MSVRVLADAPVALVDHARAERPGLDQVERDSGLLGHRGLGEPGISLDAVERAAKNSEDWQTGTLIALSLARAAA